MTDYNDNEKQPYLKMLYSLVQQYWLFGLISFVISALLTIFITYMLVDLDKFMFEGKFALKMIFTGSNWLDLLFPLLALFQTLFFLYATVVSYFQKKEKERTL